MKKLFSFLIILLLIFSSAISVYAVDKVSFNITDCVSDKNRLFTVDVVAECDAKLSASTFEFTYDKNFIEFRSAKVTDDESRITTNEMDNCVKAVYLNANGKSIENGEAIFTLTFKAINSGVSYIDFNVSDCVDSDVEFLDIESCASSKVTVSGNTSEENGNSNGKTSNDNSDTEKSDSSRDKEQETTAISTYDELGLLNPIDDKSTRFLIIGIGLGASAIVLFMLGYFISKKILDRKKNTKDKSSDS